MAKILNFGSLNIDYVYRMDHIIRPGETEPSQSREIFPGGKGLNQSVACARAGAEVYHAGAVGNGDNEVLLKVLREAGVHDDYLMTHPEVPTGHTVIQVDKGGQNSIILFGGSNQSLRRSEIDETLKHFGSGDLLVLQNETNELEYLMRQASARGLKIAFNVSPFDESLLALPLELCSYLLVNEIEAAAIAGMSSESEAAVLIKAVSAKLPACTVVMTLGTRGSVCSVPGSAPVEYGCYKVKAVDTTGSGDTFTGFFLQSMLLGKDVKSAMKLAACAAAISVTRAGAACSIPSLSEVENSELLKTEPVFAG
ncbi:MAG: ribokinase [Succinivibrio sp.]|nr:ribokinase [Succinivibrio sp.]